MTSLTVEKVSILVPADDLHESVAFWSALLGTPTFVDGDRWAQFDVGGARVAIGALSERPAVTSVMMKVTDLADAAGRLKSAGAIVGEIEEGEHESRFAVAGPTGERIVLYQPRQ